jgi:Diguanylate cyclase, GGDEF domain
MSAAALLVVTECVLFARRLPVLIHGLDTTSMAKVTAPVALPLVLASLLVCARAVRGRAGPERWSSVAILVCLCDLCLTYSSRYRLGWYTGRTLTVTASAVVLMAMLASFRRLKAAAELNAAYDGLTALVNRRSAYDSATAMIARARRTGTALNVLMFDLDRLSRSTTTTATLPGTRCWGAWRAPCAPPSATATLPPGSVVRSSPWCCPTPACRMPGWSPSGSARSCAPAPSRRSGPASLRASRR